VCVCVGWVGVCVCVLLGIINHHQHRRRNLFFLSGVLGQLKSTLQEKRNEKG